MYSVVTEKGEAMPIIRRLRPDFDDLLAQRDLAVREFARNHDISHQTLFALLRPSYQSKQRRLGGMHKQTAWKIANAWAKVAGVTPAAAYAEIIIEDSSPTTDAQ
jgi:hypothetical protein